MAFEAMVLFDVDAQRLADHFNRHKALYRPWRDNPKVFTVTISAGTHCSAIYSNQTACPEGFLRPIGHQLAGLWMSVDYHKGDTWTLSCYRGFDHLLSHNVNPWAHDPEYIYDESRISYRINKLCRLFPQFETSLTPYLLLWQFPPDPERPSLLVGRTGKARQSDCCEYGNPQQYLDFMKVFGIDLDKANEEIEVIL